MASTDNPKWFNLAKTYIGIREVPGTGASKSNPKIDQMFRDAGFKGMYDDTSWCAAFVSACLKRTGYPVLKNLTARSGLSYGTRLTTPKVGCIVVFWRESPSSWKGHIGFVSGINHATKTLKVIGGNQSNAVTEQTFPMSRVLAYRWPVESTIKALKVAGSSEAAQSQTVKAVGVGTVAVGVVNGAIEQPPTWMPEVTLPEIDAIKAITDRAYDWMHYLSNSSGLLMIAIGIAVWWFAGQWQANRLERAKRGYPILAEDIEADEVMSDV